MINVLMQCCFTDETSGFCLRVGGSIKSLESDLQWRAHGLSIETKPAASSMEPPTFHHQLPSSSATHCK